MLSCENVGQTSSPFEFGGSVDLEKKTKEKKGMLVDIMIMNDDADDSDDDDDDESDDNKSKNQAYQNHRTKFHSTCTFPILSFSLSSSSSQKSIHDITGLESMTCDFSFCACAFFCNFNLANSRRLIGTFGDCPGGEIGKVEELDELELMD